VARNLTTAFGLSLAGDLVDSANVTKTKAYPFSNSVDDIEMINENGNN